MSEYYKQLHACGGFRSKQIGCEDDISFSGCSHVIDPHGIVIESLPLLEEAPVSVKIEMDELPRARIGYSILRDEKFISSLHELKRIRKKSFGH